MAIQTNVPMKALIVGVVAITFTIPLAMIGGVVKERSQYRQKATAEIATSTAGSQTLVGPLLVVRYRERVPAATKGAVETIREGATLLLPASLAVRSNARVEMRERGIYHVPVFRTNTAFAADFTVPPRLGVNDRTLVGEPKAAIVFGVSDARGIRAVPSVRLNGSAVKAAPGTGVDWIPNGFSVPLPDGAAGRLTTETNLELIGTDNLMFLPVGDVTNVELTSEWPHPSFVGGFLPDERKVTPQGFEARWRLSRFATGLDDAAARIREGLSPAGAVSSDNRRGGTLEASKAALGVRFVQPVDVYAQSERATKYGFLFVFLTFVAFFLFEVLRRMAVHPIQYTLCGAALALFFLLLLSLSEHVPFAAAYGIASAACVGLVAFYVGHVLRRAKRGLMFGTVLATMYGFLYVILQSEDYALLLGSLLLFATLAIVMIMTRRVDWYRLSEQASPASTTSPNTSG